MKVQTHMKVELTSNWSPERFAPYGAAVTGAMRKLAERFPREVRIEHLAQEVVSGKRQLWLILDDDDHFVSFVLTEIQVNDATGLKTLVIPSFAGEEGAGTVPLIGALENWAREQGCDEVMVWGRLGWKKPLAKQGYSLDLAIFRKPLCRPSGGDLTPSILASIEPTTASL
jgi:hypothetical protein